MKKSTAKSNIAQNMTLGTLLLVDDEPEFVELAAQKLSQMVSSRVLTAKNGEEAIRIIRGNGDIRIVFTDLRMPVLDGFQLLQWIKAEQPHIEVVVTSGCSDATEEELIELGARAYLSKPYDLDLIEALATNSLQKSDQMDVKMQQYGVAVVEDDVVDQKLLKRGFKQKNWQQEVQLHFFQSGEELLDRMATDRFQPDLFIFDINLPGMTGLETVEVLRKQNLVGSETKIIILSSSELCSDRKRARNLGVNCYYAKPTGRHSWWHIARSIGQSWLRLTDPALQAKTFAEEAKDEGS